MYAAVTDCLEKRFSGVPSAVHVGRSKDGIARFMGGLWVFDMLMTTGKRGLHTSCCATLTYGARVSTVCKLTQVPHLSTQL